MIGTVLLKMSVSNFKSFDGVATLDLVSSTKVRKLATHVVSFGDVKVLRNAAVYGANASGKSNLWSAFRILHQSLSFGSLPLGTSEWFCKLRPENADRPSTFDLMFEIAGRFYDYGFSAMLKDRSVVSEWLYLLDPRADRKWNSTAVYEYSMEGDTEGLPRLGEVPGATEDDRARFALYARDFVWGLDRLFLTELNRNKRYESGSFFLRFVDAYRGMVEGMRVMGAGEARPQSNAYLSVGTLPRVSALLSGFDTGIEQIEPRRITQAELRELVPQDVIDDVRGIARQAASQTGTLSEARYQMVVRAPGALVVIEGYDQSEPVLTKLILKHGGSFFDFEFGEESEGTQRLFDFIEMLLCAEDGAVFVVDEIDRSLHPMLTRHLVELFNQLHAHDHVQLIFTTHEDSLMDFGCLRKDEIWFVDRKESRGSILYPLDAFSEVRSDTSVDRNYWNGRYGGVPVLASVESMAS